MLVKVRPNRRPHRVKHEIDSLAARQFGRGHKIRITGNQNELVDLSFVSQRRDIKSDTHVDSLLPQIQSKILIRNASPLTLPVDERPERIWCELPAHLRRRYMTET